MFHHYMIIYILHNKKIEPREVHHDEETERECKNMHVLVQSRYGIESVRS